MQQKDKPTPAMVHKGDGGRRVELFVPFEESGSIITEIDFGPFTLDHVLKWQAGKYLTSLDLLCELAGMHEKTIRKLRYPDADRVFEVFLDMLPMTLRSNIENGIVPAFPTGKPTMGPQDGYPPMAPMGAGDEDNDAGPEFDLG